MIEHIAVTLDVYLDFGWTFGFFGGGEGLLLVLGIWLVC